MADAPRSAPGRRLYAWRCHACAAPNPADTSACTACGFPARATGRQINAARATADATRRMHTPEAPLPDYPPFGYAFASLSIGRQIVVVIGIILTVVGGIGLKFAMSLATTAISVALLIAGGLLFSLAQAGLE